jgi:hypothetical protein
MITINVKRNGASVFSHEISSFNIADALSAMLTDGYVDTGIQKNALYTVEISDGQSTISKLCTFLSYQFNVQTYQQTVDGVTSTVTGVTNNSLVFSIVS